ncbi:MAG: hypothetical protein KKG47_10930 [Proteobacteria bacterium]|nr:hypothetical protein [Pseudomonadota bacterium]MBU1738618.1 hypothetical protein [Pseudomonadota bacterium]
MKKIILGIIVFWAAVAPGAALAEVVGALMPSRNVPYFMLVHDAFVKELKALGSDAEVILQKPSANELSWRNATRKLMVLEAKVIVAYGSDTALAISTENKTIPVVYTGAYDPEGMGVNAETVTGMSATVPLKGLIGNLKKISDFKTLGILYSGTEMGSVRQMESAVTLAEGMGAKILRINTAEADFSNLPDTDAILLTSAAEINQKSNLAKIIDKARAKKMATASVLCGTCENGVLISLSANPEHQGQGAAKMVAAILKGTKPSDIPADKTPKVEMTINLKEAKDLGLSIPFELLGTSKVVK